MSYPLIVVRLKIQLHKERQEGTEVHTGILYSLITNND